MTIHTGDRATTQVIHPLAVLAGEGLLEEQSWPGVARVLLDQGFRWPALPELAALYEPEEYRVVSRLKNLATQTDRDLTGSPRLDPWDVIAGLYGRAWRLGMLDETLAMWRMDHVWFHIRDLQKDHSHGVRILWTAMGVKEFDDDHPSSDVPARAEAVLSEADSLLEPHALSYPLCEAIREAMDNAGY
ncbi:hypothetical protein [Nocardia sp. NBC_01327]|uniref:hypothetical protein n=1 Tax=Nocardia sp. NBC_01327 TaxID=2903593 RepID=UPI002E1138FF|nr:hypothetical protein OG326_30840 [Nocardia sp. NBC_01327]